MTRVVVGACLLAVVICLPAASEGQQYWGGNPWRQYWQPSRNPNCERAYPARQTNGYVHACRYPCVGLPIRYNFEEDGTPCYADRWQPGTCSAGRCQRAWWAPAPVTAPNVASTTAPATTSQAQPQAHNVERQGCPRAYPATDVRRSCRYLCQGWPLRHQNEDDGTPCQLSSWRQGFCYLGHCQKIAPVPKPVQEEDNNVEGTQGSSARQLRCRNYRGRETVDGAVRSCTFVCKRRKNAFLALEDNGTPCWGWQGQRGYCDQGVCKAFEVPSSTAASETIQTEASATESVSTLPGSSTPHPYTDATTVQAITAAVTDVSVTDQASVSTTTGEATASPATRSPWVPGFVGVKCDRAFPAKQIDGQMTSCRYLCEGYPRIRIGFEADGTPCLKKKTTPGVCSSGFCKPLPPPTTEPAPKEESTTHTATTENFTNDDFDLTTVPSSTGETEEAEGTANIAAESTTSLESDVSNSAPTSATEGSLTTAVRDSSLVTSATTAGQTNLPDGSTVAAAVSTRSPSLAETTDKKEQLPQEQSTSDDGLKGSTDEAFTEQDAVAGTTTATIAVTTIQKEAGATSTATATGGQTGTDSGSDVTDVQGLSTSSTLGDEEASRDEIVEGPSAPSSTEHLVDVSTDAFTVEGVSGPEAATQANGYFEQEEVTVTTTRSEEAEIEVVQTKTTVLNVATEENTVRVTPQPERESDASSKPKGSEPEDFATVSTEELPQGSGIVTVEVSTPVESDAHATSPVSAERSSEPPVNTELPNKSESPFTTNAPVVAEKEVHDATEVISTEEAAVSAAGSQSTEAFDGHTDEASEASTSASAVASTDAATSATVVTNAETIATGEDEKVSEEQTTEASISQPIATQPSTETNSRPSDVSIPTVVEPQFTATERPTQEADSEIGTTTRTIVKEEEHVSEVIVTADAKSTPSSVVDATKENEPVPNDGKVTTDAVEEATAATLAATVATAAASVPSVEESATHAELGNDFDDEVNTGATAGVTVIFVEKTSTELVSEAVTEALEEVTPESTQGALEEDAKEEVTTNLPEADVTEGSAEGATPQDESATVKVITTITRKEIVRPVDPSAAEANVTSVDTTRTTSVETLPASEVSINKDDSSPAEADDASSESSSSENPIEVSTGVVPGVLSDATEGSQSEDESATVKVITTITRTEIVRPVDPEPAQEDITSVQKTSSSSVETVPVSASNSPTTVDSIVEVDDAPADESAPATTEEAGAVSSGPHIIITDFVQKTAVSSKEPVTVPTAEDQTAAAA